jgi:hypothetical protein
MTYNFSTPKLTQINYFNDKNILDFAGSYQSSFVLIGFEIFFL